MQDELTVSDKYCLFMEYFPKTKYCYELYKRSLSEIFTMAYCGNSLTSVADTILYLDKNSALKVFDTFYVPFGTQLIANMQSLNIVLWSKDKAQPEMVNCLKRVMITIIFMLSDCFCMEI